MSGLQYNATTGEPLLRLPPPFTNIIITPPRMSDVAPSVRIMNDPAVYAFMGRSTPYSEAIAEKWITKVKAVCDGVVVEVRRGETETAVSGCPVRHIREECADGTEVYIGDVGLGRSPFTEVADRDERARLVAENEARKPGDPEIVWHVGYYLAPSHHGRGLMTAAVGTIITQWGIPRMRIKCMRSSAFEGNLGSLKVLQKNEFVVVDFLEEHVQVGEEKKGLHVLKWNPARM
ncbi:hypothetical protein GGX14DRAFT_529993 [Mycena pura]|uniref:N-acetyltransferase domain-containing protein n=1 Tax=Mycena pura TaxID=153505 RepID=A0AAD7E606_9AGAR|nr:hypothetical protein GGX14DRAFT_529993 [Mycena pura]